MASDRTNLVMKPYSRNWRYLSGLLPQQKQAVWQFYSVKVKHKHHRQRKHHLFKKSCHLFRYGPCHLAVGFGPWKSFFTKEKTRIPKESTKTQVWFAEATNFHLLLSFSTIT